MFASRFPATMMRIFRISLRTSIHGHLPSLSYPSNVSQHRKYWLTPWSRFLLEKLTGLQLVKKFPAFYGTRRFITALTGACHLSLSWASSIHSIPSHPTTWGSILILSSHLRLGLPSGLLPSGFPTKTLYTPLKSSLATITSPQRGLFHWSR
jgi:hypothetical protein